MGRVRALRVYGWEQRVRVPLQQACGVRRRAAAETGDRAWCSALRGRLAGGRLGVQEGQCHFTSGAERRRPATERGAVRCAGGWRADAWGAGGSVRVAGKLEGSFADKSIGNDEPLACCVGVGRNTQSAGDNEPLVCRPLQVS